MYIQNKKSFDEKNLFFNCIRMIFVLLCILKKIERIQNAIDADISFCKWLQNKFNMWTLYDCKTEKEAKV